MKKPILLFMLLLFTTVLFPYEVVKDLFWGSGPLVMDNQGNMYVGYDEHSIVKYSPKGEELLKMGQDGNGPSDLKRVGWHAFNPKDNNIYVTEYYEGNRWISRFNVETGKFVGIWNYEMDRSQYDVVASIAFDNQGNVLLLVGKQSTRRIKDFEVSNQKWDLLKYSPAGKLLATIYKFNADSSAYKHGNFTVTIPFQNNLGWIIDQDKIIVKEMSSNVINVFAPTGKLEKLIPFPVKKEEVTKEDINDWEKDINSSTWIKELIAKGVGDVKFWKKRLPYPQFKPNSSGMLSDSKGNLYVREYIGYQERQASWYKINLHSGKTEKMKFKSGEELSLIWKNFFIFSKTDEEEGTETITKIEEKELQKW